MDPFQIRELNIPFFPGNLKIVEWQQAPLAQQGEPFQITQQAVI